MAQWEWREWGRLMGGAKKMGMIVVGNNALSTDAVATRLMGLDPESHTSPQVIGGKRVGRNPTSKHFSRTQGLFEMGDSLSILLLPNSPFLFLMWSFMMKDRAAPAFQPCWSFFKIIICSLRTTVWRTEKFILESVRHLNGLPEGNHPDRKLHL